MTAHFWKEKVPGMYSVYNDFPPLILRFKDLYLYSTPSMEYPGLIKVRISFRVYHSNLKPHLPTVGNRSLQFFSELCVYKLT